MKTRTQKQKAETLLSLHTNGTLLVLPNVWDPFGARILEKKGCSAIATSSAAISASLGYQDGEMIKRSTHLALIERIVRCVDVPVTADIESGYGESLPELEETADQVLEAGVAGVNLEDSVHGGGPLRSIRDQCERISTLRQWADRRGVPLVINARIDTYYSSAFTTNEAALAGAVERAAAYMAAGADCVYPMGPGDEATVRLLRDRIQSPLNILAQPTTAPIAVLQAIGVNRVSFGPYIFRSCARKFEHIADILLSTRDYSCFSDMLSRAEARDYLLAGSE